MNCAGESRGGVNANDAFFDALQVWCVVRCDAAVIIKWLLPAAQLEALPQPADTCRTCTPVCLPAAEYRLSLFE